MGPNTWPHSVNGGVLTRLAAYIGRLCPITLDFPPISFNRRLKWKLPPASLLSPRASMNAQNGRGWALRRRTAASALPLGNAYAIACICLPKLTDTPLKVPHQPARANLFPLSPCAFRSDNITGTPCQVSQGDSCHPRRAPTWYHTCAQDTNPYGDFFIARRRYRTSFQATPAYRPGAWPLHH